MATKLTQDAKTGVKTYECDQWDDFIIAQRSLVGRFVGGYFYRGHAKTEWQLSSPFERWLHKLKGGNKDRNVRELFGEGAYEKFQECNLSQFIDLAKGLPNFDARGLNESDWLTLARHHGLKSALLDWSRSPYIAAFFAFIEAVKLANQKYGQELGSPTQGATHISTEPVAIWAIANSSEFVAPGEFEFVHSRAEINYWQKAQQGLFTKLSHDVHVDVESYLVSRDFGHHLERYIVPGNEATKALGDLMQMNITYASLFPDLRGAALQANLAQFYFGLLL